MFTGVVEVEPQFVLAADDSKNIFARPSTAALNDIEASENKKPGTADSRKKRAKKVVLRKKMKSATRDINSASSEAVLRKEGEESGDDGFRNYDGTAAPRVMSPPDSAIKSFNETNRSLGFADASNSTTRKINNVPLQRIDSD